MTSWSDGPGPLPVERVALVILDGWGLAEAGPGNAVELADTPNFDELWRTHQTTQLTACGPAVGLPEGQMGNSEVGHLNLGAGSVVKQDLMRIDEAIADGSIARNDVLKAVMAQARESGRLHLLGLVSHGGVHSSERHLKALIEMAAAEDVPDIVLHAFTDGRDTLPTSGAAYVAEAEEWLRATGHGRVGTVSGRYFAMDRDKRWDRIQLAFDAMVEGKSEFHADSGTAAVEAAYERDETDEFIKPTVVGDDARIREGDAVLFFNFRPDRARQMSTKLDEFSVRLTTLTEYQEDWDFPIAFPPDRPQVTMASTLADRGIAQLHVAETEKYAHVTYFFNGGEEHPYSGEERYLVDSRRDVPTYDHAPEMSAAAAADQFVSHWTDGDFGFVIINFANPDMVGHTGSIPAAVKAIEAVDAQLKRIVEAVHAKGGALLITADHGNADHMLEPDGSPNTQHSLNPVPVIVMAEVGGVRSSGILADVTPTLLELLGQDQPEAMTGESLIEHAAHI